jgi:hypothetical protein
MGVAFAFQKDGQSQIAKMIVGATGHYARFVITPKNPENYEVFDKTSQ